MISVCLATYNGEKYIKEQLDSILPQLSSLDEIIISDDGSKDRTLEIIASYQDKRIIIYRNSFKNVVLNFEFAINKSKGNYIFLSDQDDVWHPEKVKTYINKFIENPNITLAISDLQIINKEGEKVEKVFYNKGFKSSLIQNLFVNNFIGCSMAFRSDIKQKILPFPKNIAMHDWWIGTCCILYGKIVFINKKLIFYRRHDNNVTKDGGGNFLSKIRWRLNLIFNLMTRYLVIKLQ